MMAKETDRLEPNVIDLHPIMRQRMLELLFKLVDFRWTNEQGQIQRFAYFEGYRTPERQRHLINTTKNTKARPWQSAHQYGLAADFAVVDCDDRGFVDKWNWSWPDNAPWAKLKEIAEATGLSVPIAWDKGHVQHPGYAEIKKAFL